MNVTGWLACLFLLVVSWLHASVEASGVHTAWQGDPNYEAARMATEHCTRFVVLAREGSGGDHFMKVLDSLRDVSALQTDPFGEGRAVRTV